MRCVSTFREGRRQWRLRAAAVSLVLTAAVVSPAAQPAFRSETDLVALQVTVVDHQRQYVPNLRVEDFKVLEEGQPQAISLFAAGQMPLDLMMVLDTSASMAGLLPMARQAAVNFVRRLGPADRAGVILVNNRVRIASALTHNAVDLEKAIREAAIAGKTALYDALYFALKELSRSRRAEHQIRRQALIVISDGEDNASRLSFDDVVNDVRGSSVMVYTIMPVRKKQLGDRTESSPVRFDMQRLAEDSGGRALSPVRVEDLAGAYETIAGELSHQYWLAFPPSRSANGFRRVAVRLVNPLFRARTRAGYYALPSRSTASAPTGSQPR